MDAPLGDRWPDFATLTHQSELNLLDRSFVIGVAVKRDPLDSLSGIITDMKASVTLRPASLQLRAGMTSESIESDPHSRFAKLENVSLDDLVSTLGFYPDETIIYQDWVGRINRRFETITIQLDIGGTLDFALTTSCTGSYARPRSTCKQVTLYKFLQRCCNAQNGSAERTMNS